MRTPLLQLIERCRRQQQQKPGQLEIPDAPKSWQGISRELTLVYRDVSDFMMAVHLATSGIPWATDKEALEQWRRETVA